MTHADDKQTIEELTAACIEAIEQGDPDPATRVCAGRPDLLTRVQRRLAKLAARALILPADEATPTEIGGYRIVRELGSGGMGAVYLAEQERPVRREVALKVVKLGMDTREVVARFASERQTLARMSHPNIAQVFDAGITAQGRPFFVMEYVPGEPLTRFCDRRNLDTRARLQLFATVCRAVQHAHDRGFIHRDLKPSNVLVGEREGTFVPKIIDFGIARAVTPQGDTQQTRIDQVLGTPEYMSPEQARNASLDIDTRTDVYSLGAMLYEVLCGELPFDSARLRRASWLEFERILGEEPPTAPSLRIAMVEHERLRTRGGSRTLLRRRLAGELDWITLKALAKDREHRYPSPLAFAEDLERWLRNEPVLAAPPSRFYPVRKFVRRHRVAAVAAAAVLLSLTVGLVVSLRATWRAEQALLREAAALGDVRSFYGLARDAVGNLVLVADRELVAVPQADAVRRRMLADAIAFYEALRARQPRDLALRIDLAAANGSIGQLQRRLGETVDAIATLRRCVEEVDALLAEAPDEVRLLQLGVTTRNHLASALYAGGRTDEAQDVLRQALGAFAAARARGALRDADAVEGTLLANLAWQSDDTDSDAATLLFERALTAFARAAELGQSDRNLRAQTAARYAETLTRRGRLEDAARALAAAALWDQGNTGDDDVEARDQRAQMHKQSAHVLRRLGKLGEARARQQEAIAAYAALAKEHPDVPGFADGEAAGWHFLCQLELDDSLPAQALASIRTAVAIRERLAQQAPQDHRQRARLVRSLLTEANVELSLWQSHGGERAAVAETLTRAAELADALLVEHAEDVESLTVHAAVHSALGSMAMGNRSFAAARRELQTVRGAVRAGIDRSPGAVELQHLLATCCENLLKVEIQDDRVQDAVAAGLEALAAVECGLGLDARHGELLEIAPRIASLLAAAQFRAGDAAAGAATLLRLAETAAWGGAAQEMGGMMMAQQLRRLQGEAGHGAWRERTIATLRAAVARRGPLEQALQRPPQTRGFSEVGSRLRDLDLRMSLAELLEAGDDDAVRGQAIDEAVAIADSLEGFDPDRMRGLFGMRAEWRLEQGDVPGAAADAGRIAGAGPDDPRNAYFAAVLFTKCSTAAPQTAELHATRAVECLRQALAAGMPKGELDDDEFAALRERTDFRQLRAR